MWQWNAQSPASAVKSQDTFPPGSTATVSALGTERIAGYSEISACTYRVRITGSDLLTLDLHATLAARLDAPPVAEDDEAAGGDDRPRQRGKSRPTGGGEHRQREDDAAERAAEPRPRGLRTTLVHGRAPGFSSVAARC